MMLITISAWSAFWDQHPNQSKEDLMERVIFVSPKACSVTSYNPSVDPGIAGGVGHSTGSSLLSSRESRTIL